MRLSSSGIALAKLLEGCLLFPYDDVDDALITLVSGVWRRPDGARVKGTPTIGIGHAIRDSEAASLNREISEAEAETIFMHDIGDTEAAVNRNVHVVLSAHQFDACVLFTFNVGVGGFAASSLLKAINAQRWADCPALFGLWDKTEIAGKLVVSPVLQRRRSKEAALFMTPVQDGDVDPDAVMALVYQTADQIAAEYFARADGDSGSA